jgi:hypothetical protein
MDWVKTLGEKTTHSCEKCRLKAQVKNKRVKHECPGSSFHAEAMHWLCCGEMYQTNLGTDFNEKLSGAENRVRGFIGKRVGSKPFCMVLSIRLVDILCRHLTPAPPVVRASRHRKGRGVGTGLARRLARAVHVAMHQPHLARRR